MYDRPDDFNEAKQNGDGNLSVSELKKLKKKQKKEKAKEALEAAAKQKQHNAKKVSLSSIGLTPFNFLI
uniref:EF-hand domain-containing protein n=1 Tax=Parascaris equorum TaxID=6256 RepID=A0A914S6D7_PAREQ